jgi:hypothetical protein
MSFPARRFPHAGISFPAHRALYKASVAVLGQHIAMADHPDTWARIIEMARAQFLATSP